MLQIGQITHARELRSIENQCIKHCQRPNELSRAFLSPCSSSNSVGAESQGFAGGVKSDGTKSGCAKPKVSEIRFSNSADKTFLFRGLSDRAMKNRPLSPGGKLGLLASSLMPFSGLLAAKRSPLPEKSFVRTKAFSERCRPEICWLPVHSAGKRGMDGALNSIAKAKML